MKQPSSELSLSDARCLTNDFVDMSGMKVSDISYHQKYGMPCAVCISAVDLWWCYRFLLRTASVVDMALAHRGHTNTTSFIDQVHACQGQLPNLAFLTIAWREMWSEDAQICQPRCSLSSGHHVRMIRRDHSNLSYINKQLFA